MIISRFYCLLKRYGLITALLVSGAAYAADKPAQPIQPALNGVTLDGKPFNLASKRGDVVLVTFWATWCPTCRAEMPMFRKFYETNKVKGFDLITVSIDDNMSDIADYAKLSNWMTNKNQAFPSMWRNAPGHKDDFGKVWATPSAFLIGRDGKVIESFKGAIKPDQWERIRAAVDKKQKQS